MPKHNDQKRQQVIDMTAAGTSQAAIGRAIGRSKSFVNRWSKRTDPRRHTGSGGLNLISAYKQNAIKKTLTKKPGTMTVSEVAQHHGVSRSVIYRIARDMHWKTYVAKQSQTPTPAQRKKRLAFAKAWLENEREWDRAVFIDETSFEVGGGTGGKRRVLAPNRESVVPDEIIDHPTKVHALGAICSQGPVALHLFTGNLDAKRFQAMLTAFVIPRADAVFGDRSWYLVMDSDPKHTAGSTVSALQSAGVEFIPKSDWPARSPDLNPIEHVWAQIKRIVRKERPKSQYTLKSTVRREWDDLALPFIHNLVESMPSRLKAVIKRRGARTKY
jgi:transposase